MSNDATIYPASQLEAVYQYVGLRVEADRWFTEEEHVDFQVYVLDLLRSGSLEDAWGMSADEDLASLREARDKGFRVFLDPSVLSQDTMLGSDEGGMPSAYWNAIIEVAKEKLGALRLSTHVRVDICTSM